MGQQAQLYQVHVLGVWPRYTLLHKLDWLRLLHNTRREAHLFEVHVLGVRTSACGHQHGFQTLDGLLPSALLLHMQGEAAVALLLDARGGAL